jgi:(p)ppGpp synthase/HD superfamily hydrolase
MSLSNAILVATAAHAQQIDKGGLPYILHPLRVMLAIASKFPDDEAIQIAAVLHDTVEDGHLTIEKIERLFGQEVVEIMDSVTRRTIAGETYHEFVLRAKAHPKGRYVKIADVEDNLLAWRLARIPDAETQKYLHERGLQAWQLLIN